MIIWLKRGTFEMEQFTTARALAEQVAELGIVDSIEFSEGDGIVPRGVPDETEEPRPNREERRARKRKNGEVFVKAKDLQFLLRSATADRGMVEKELGAPSDPTADVERQGVLDRLNAVLGGR